MKYFVLVALLIATSAPAHAYIDPGSGSYALQMAMAGLMAIAFTIKLYWQRLKTFVTKRFAGRSASDKPTGK